MPTIPVFSKPTFTLPELASALFDLAPHLPRLLLATVGPRRMDPRLREIVLLAVSEANDCRYCRAAHGELARGAGVSEEEAEALRRHRWTDLPPREGAAVIAALRRAGIGVPEAEAGDVRLEEHLRPGEVADVAAFVDAIRIANLTGNTVDMMLDRVLGRRRPRRDSTLWSEAAVTGVWSLGALPAGLAVAGAALARRLRAER